MITYGFHRLRGCNIFWSLAHEWEPFQDLNRWCSLSLSMSGYPEKKKEHGWCHPKRRHRLGGQFNGRSRQSSRLKQCTAGRFATFCNIWWCNNHLQTYESQWEGLSHILWICNIATIVLQSSLDILFFESFNVNPWGRAHRCRFLARRTNCLRHGGPLSMNLESCKSRLTWRVRFLVLAFTINILTA